MRTSIARRHRSPNAVSASGPRKQGYTLIELMIVVAITGVLASIALPAFGGYVNRGRAGEAVTFLGSITLRQESYRAEFGGYAGTVTEMGAATWVPETGDRMAYGIQLPWPGSPDFDAIGVRPDAANVRFGYAMCAGTPNDGQGYVTEDPYNVPQPQLDFYFIAQAQADFDGDGDVMTFEVASFARNIWSSNDNGWE